MAMQFAPRQTEPKARAIRARQDELLRAGPQGAAESKPPIALQRHVGNAALQRMLTSSRDVIHRKGCSCATCAANAAAREENTVQRFWDDEQSDSDSGGSLWDAVTDAASSVADSVSDAYNSLSGGTGGSSQSSESTGGSESGGVSGGEHQPEGGASEGGWLDWLDDWWQSDDSQNQVTGRVDDEEGSSGVGGCVGAIGHGGSSSGGVTVNGLTKANFSHSKPYTFAGGKVYEKDGEKKQDITISLTMTYTANPTVDFEVIPDLSTLSECKQAAVNAFKSPSGALGKHEQEHVNKFKTYNGSETAKWTITVNPDNVQSEVDSAVSEKVTELNDKREQDARDASDKLDPWSQAIPGIADCKDPQPDADSGGESESESE